MKILLCEDEIDLNNAISKTLQLSGFDVETAFDGEQAFYRASKCMFMRKR